MAYDIQRKVILLLKPILMLIEQDVWMMGREPVVGPSS